MDLYTDEQTIDDLRIFGKRDTSGVYDLYNHTHTRGGEKILEEMFRRPLSDRDAINNRCSIIEQFSRLKVVFPFDATLFDMAEKYLANAGELWKNGSRNATLSEKEIHNGVTAVIDLLLLLQKFIRCKEATGIAAYGHERAEIAVLLADPVFAPALQEKPKARLSYGAVAAYDNLFRVRERDKIEKLMGHVYYLDVYLSVAKVASDRNFIFPRALEKGRCMLKLEGVYHPELTRPVGNSMEMDAGKSVIFLTGANMAGKSTFLRALSTAVYIAHMGFPVAAKSMEFSVFDGIYTTINLPDNLGIGASHFYAEVLRVKKMASELNSGKSLFIIFDELFRGTNVKDAHEATVAVTNAFAGNKSSLFIISSHIVEAGDELKRLPNIGFWYLPTRMNGHTPEYTYRLERGITADRHGMVIIRNEGILETLENGQKRNHGNGGGGFHTDRQTVDELNLLGKFRPGSVYHLFGQVKTRGGERLLDDMFRYPLEDAQAINTRSEIFQFFQQANPGFPFDVQQLNMMREFLDTSTARNGLLVLTGNLIKKALAGLTRDERYRKNVQGLQAAIVTLNRCYSFIETVRGDDGPFAGRIRSMRELLSSRQLERLRKIDIYKALPLRTLAYYEHLLKTKLYKEMEAVLEFISELDVYISVSDVARSRGFAYAKAFPRERNMLSAASLGHPCIAGAVGNDLSMDEDSNVVFLTGANMAGKSTLMKSVGIGLYMAHMGFPVAAKAMAFSVREGLYSSINVSDNIGLGYSHFYAEVVRVKQAAEAASSGRRLLLMFDELFKGTNVKDAYDGTLSVTEGFAGYRDCLFIVSTHIIEVGEALKGHKNVHFVYMPTVMEGSRPRYTYRLKEGITEDRQGMMIIRNEGILELINVPPAS